MVGSGGVKMNTKVSYNKEPVVKLKDRHTSVSKWIMFQTSIGELT